MLYKSIAKNSNSDHSTRNQSQGQHVWLSTQTHKPCRFQAYFEQKSASLPENRNRYVFFEYLVSWESTPAIICIQTPAFWILTYDWRYLTAIIAIFDLHFLHCAIPAILTSAGERQSIVLLLSSTGAFWIVTPNDHRKRSLCQCIVKSCLEWSALSDLSVLSEWCVSAFAA